MKIVHIALVPDLAQKIARYERSLGAQDVGAKQDVMDQAFLG